MRRGARHSQFWIVKLVVVVVDGDSDNEDCDAIVHPYDEDARHIRIEGRRLDAGDDVRVL